MRDLRSRELFSTLRQHCEGSVLDVGGWNFYQTAIKEKVNFLTWTVVEPSLDKMEPPTDQRVCLMQGDGCGLVFQDNSYDTVISVQVLEHVFEPNKMFAEFIRVLKPGGKGIIMVPQTSNIHLAPHHHYNFTRFWCEEASRIQGVNILLLKPLGGFWSSLASRLVLFFFQSFRCQGMTSKDCSRNLFFYVLFPLMSLFAVAAIPICLFFSLGDLSEEPNNLLLVIKKPDSPVNRI
jgi:SAM-dependent methyltransferase